MKVIRIVLTTINITLNHTYRHKHRHQHKEQHKVTSVTDKQTNTEKQTVHSTKLAEHIPELFITAFSSVHKQKPNSLNSTCTCCSYWQWHAPIIPNKHYLCNMAQNEQNTHCLGKIQQKCEFFCSTACYVVAHWWLPACQLTKPHLHQVTHFWFKIHVQDSVCFIHHLERKVGTSDHTFQVQIINYN